MSDKLTPEEKQSIQNFVDTGEDITLPEAEFKLYCTFYQDMPYGVAKARDGTPDEWYGEHLTEIQNWLDRQ